MKPKPNRKRKAGNGFNGVDQATDYAVRFQRAKDGWWWSTVQSFIALSCAPSLRTVKRHTNEAIGYHLKGLRQKPEAGSPTREKTNATSL